MATYEELMNAARNADAAGDWKAAQQLVRSATSQNRQAGFRQRALEMSATNDAAAPAATQALDQRTEDTIAIDQAGGRNAAIAGAALSGLPFVGSYIDEFAGSVANAMGQDGEKYRNDKIAASEAFARQNPKMNTALEVAGGIAGSIPLAMAAPAVAGSGALAMQALRLGGAGAVAGATEGAIYGSGQQEGPGRAVNAARGGVVGGAVGGVLGVGAPLLVEGGRAAIQSIRRTPERQVAQELGVRPESARLLASVLDTENPQAISQSLARGGDGAMLADSSPTAMGVLDTTIQAPGAAARTGRERVETRAAQAMTNINTALDETLGSPQGLISISGDIRQAAQPNVREAYTRAYDTPIDYSSDAGRNIEGILSRLPKSTAGRALASAQERMAYDGVPNAQIMARVADDGSVTFEQMPNVMQMDYLKRSFDDIARNGTDAVTGKMNADAAFASRIARDIRNATRDAVPAYGDALNLAADSITTQAAVETGQKFLQPQFTREMASRALDGATDAEKSALRAGLRSQIDDTLANVRSVASDPNIDARQAQEALKQLSSQAAKAKIRMLLPMDQANRLLGQMDEAGQALALRAAVSTNSRTAGRQMTKEFIDDVTAPGGLTQLAQLRPINAAQEIVSQLTGNTARDISGRSQQIMAEVTDVLTRSGRPEAERAVQLLRKVSDGQPLSEGQARLVAGIFTSAVSGAGYQSAGQVTGTR